MQFVQTPRCSRKRERFAPTPANRERAHPPHGGTRSKQKEEQKGLSLVCRPWRVHFGTSRKCGRIAKTECARKSESPSAFASGLCRCNGDPYLASRLCRVGRSRSRSIALAFLLTTCEQQAKRTHRKYDHINFLQHTHLLGSGPFRGRMDLAAHDFEMATCALSNRKTIICTNSTSGNNFFAKIGPI